MSSEQLIQCCYSGREMALTDCIDRYNDTCPCTPNEHACCDPEPEQVDYEPEFDASQGIWIHDPLDCKDYFSITDYPPQCAWRAVVAQVDNLYDDIQEGEFVLVGYDSVCERWMPDKEVEWALRKEADGWSYHGVFAMEGMYGYVKYAYKPVMDRREIAFTPIQCMGPVAPRIHPNPFVFHPVLQLKLHDPFQLIGMTEDGRFPGTFPAHIRIASPEFWKSTLDEITWSMAVYNNPKVGDVVRITESEYTFCSHNLPLTVRYLAEYDGSIWHPMMTIQHKGQEFIGYTHDWLEIDPINPAPSV